MKVFIGVYDLITARYLVAVYKTAEIIPKETLLNEVLVSEDEMKEIYTTEEVERIKKGSYWIAQALMRDIVCGNATLTHCHYFETTCHFGSF